MTRVFGRRRDQKELRSMTTYQARKALRDIDLFAGLPESALDDLLQAGTTFTTNPGHRIISEGGADAGLQVILEGSAEITVNGEPRPSLGPGDHFGEISMIDGSPRSATVVSGPEGMTTFALSSLAFAPMIERPEVSRVLLRALCARIRAIQEPASDTM
jgi:CRP/FNR family transcriptional regulator, cyclic AMP receptor protein